MGSPSDPLGFARDLRGIPRDLTRDPQLFIYQQFEGIPRDLEGIRKGFGGIPRDSPCRARDSPGSRDLARDSPISLGIQGI